MVTGHPLVMNADGREVALFILIYSQVLERARVEIVPGLACRGAGAAAVAAALIE